MKTVELTCHNCGTRLEVDGPIAVCPACGTKSFLDDEHRTTTHNYVHIQRDEARIHESDRKEKIRVMELEYNERKERRNRKMILWIIIVAVAIIAISGVGVAINKKISQAQGKISAGNYRAYIEKDYEAVVQQFEEMGFTNIVVIDLDDAGLDFWNNEEVESISIAGETHFDGNDYFYPDDKVIIRYY